jgi:hypothetical protein
MMRARPALPKTLGFLVAALTALATLGVAPVSAADGAPAGTSPAPRAQEAERVFDHMHTAWDALLKQHVKQVEGGKQTFIDYGAIKANPAPLRSYLSTLSAVSAARFATFSRSEQLAFLINAYNAFLVELVVDNYPLTSIKSVGIPFVGPWKKAYIPLLGKKQSPDDLEHGLLRKNYKEPRIHFGVNCASFSCPPLRAEAFVASRLEGQLDEQARLFFSNTRENRFDAPNKTLTLNPILNWFEEDFTSTGPEGHVRFVARFHGELGDALRKGLSPSSITVSFGDYNWELNDTARSKTP